MSPTRYGYTNLGLEPIDLLQYQSHRARQQPMGDEKKDDGVGDPFKMLLEEALAGQRNKMMDKFAQILRQLPTGEASSSSGHANPFKVQVNFDVPLFEGLKDVDVVDKRLNLLEGYFRSTIFPIGKILLLHSSRSSPMLRLGGTLTLRKGP
jgi:hypothetical protein